MDQANMKKGSEIFEYHDRSTSFVQNDMMFEGLNIPVFDYTNQSSVVHHPQKVPV
jgi:hypothetical protein